MANIRHIMDAATAHEFGTIPGQRFWMGHTQASDRRAKLPVPTVGERYGASHDLQIAPGAVVVGSYKGHAAYSSKPHMRLHTRRIGEGGWMLQWCVEYGGRRTRWEFSLHGAFKDARDGDFRYVVHPRTI